LCGNPRALPIDEMTVAHPHQARQLPIENDP
jgi:hypothetical protein